MQGNRQAILFLYFAYFISQIGSWAFRIGVLVGLLQSSTNAVGIGVAVIFAPIILGSLFLSPLVDRSDRLTIMIGIDLLRAAAMVPILLGGAIDSIITYIILVIMSISQPVFMSAQVSFLRSITPPEDMVTALRNISNIDWTTYILGMTAGALMIAHVSITGILILNAITFILSAGLIAFVKTKKLPFNEMAITNIKSGTLSDLKPLYASFLSVFMLNLGAGIINVYPAVRSTINHITNQSNLSTIIIINGIFGLIGALSVKSIYERVGALRAMVASAALVTFSLFVMTFDINIFLTVAGSSIMLGAGQVFAVSAQTHMVSSVSKDRAGKLSGIFQCCTYGGIALNGVLFSVLSKAENFNLIVAFCAISAFAAFCIAGKETARQVTKTNSENNHSSG